MNKDEAELQETIDKIKWYKDEIKIAVLQHNKKAHDKITKELIKLKKKRRTLYMRIYSRKYYTISPDMVIKADNKYVFDFGKLGINYEHLDKINDGKYQEQGDKIREETR